MKKTRILKIAVLAAFTLIPLVAQASFRDVPTSNPHFEAITSLENGEIISGYKDGTFKPDQLITRAELVKITLSHVGYEASKIIYDTKFKDVPPDSWFAPYVKKCLELQAISVNPDVPLFFPAAPITKIDALRIIIPIEGIPAPYINDNTKIIFPDVSSDAPYAYLVRAAQKAGIISKSDGELLKPFANLTRGEAAELLFRAQEYRSGVAGTTPDNQSPGITESDYLSQSEYDLINNDKFPIFLDVWDRINTDFIDKNNINRDDLVYGAISGLVQTLNDPYSNFENPENTIDLQNSLEGSFEGIGVVIDTFENDFMIMAVMKNSPAEKAGLEIGDIIKEIDGNSSAGKTADEIVNLIKGKAGTAVNLVIQRGSNNLTFNITREQLTLDSVITDSTPNVIIPDNIAYMSIYQFTGTTGSEFTDIYKTEMAKNPIGIILDLRDDPGGYLDAAFEVLGHFVENGKPIAILQMDGRTETQLSEGEGEFAKTKIPMIVLVNDGTASSAEIVAGTIQDYKLGKLLGITTYGKGTVQEITTYPDNSSLKLSIAHWFTGLKRDINKIGLTPDITVTPTADDLLGKTDTQLSAAIKLLQ